MKFYTACVDLNVSLPNVIWPKDTEPSYLIIKLLGINDNINYTVHRPHTPKLKLSSTYDEALKRRYDNQRNNTRPDNPPHKSKA